MEIVDKGGDENVIDLQHSSVDGHALDRPGGETNGLCGGAILAEPHHDFVRRIRGAAAELFVGTKEHIHTHVGIQAASREFSRRRDSRIVIANGIMPVNVDIEVLETGQLHWQGAGKIELGVGKGVDGFVIWQSSSAGGSDADCRGQGACSAVVGRRHHLLPIHR